MEYKLYQSNLIKNNHQAFINDCKTSYNFIKKEYGWDTTWGYYKYNIFSLTSSNLLIH